MATAAALPGVDRAAFLRTAQQAAADAGHVWPAYAACEAALDSNFGTTEIARNAHNYFNFRAPSKLSFSDRIYTMRTVLQTVDWLSFRDMTECFAYRMVFLRRFNVFYAALREKTPEGYLKAIAPLWSADPKRAATVLALEKAMVGA